MSYLVLARKYRPRNFSEMVGQEHVVQALTNALTQQRLHLLVPVSCGSR
jgi:DNA polymerase-3 subunit gamma/tau